MAPCCVLEGSWLRTTSVSRVTLRTKRSVTEPSWLSFTAPMPSAPMMTRS